MRTPPSALSAMLLLVPFELMAADEPRSKPNIVS
jgi:hypothetical protein